MEKITPEQLLAAYAHGFFPMAEKRHSRRLGWYFPETRGVLPLEGFHVPRSLRKFLRKSPFRITVNRACAEVIAACAERSSTWINDEIIALYTELHRLGFAHSVECWEEDRLAGGLYGIALAGAFFGESMFSRAENASKAAIVHLAERLRHGGYTLLDAQYVNEHLKQFGVEEIPAEEYLRRLRQALTITPEPVFAS